MALFSPIPRGHPIRVVLSSPALLPFISVRKTAGLVIAQLGVAAFFVSGVTRSTLGESAGWFVLAATVLAGFEMLTATAMGAFEAEISKAVVLALFVPLIISSGGNSGSQAATLVIRALALGEVTVRDWWRVMRREILAGLCLGAILGSIGFLRITLWSHSRTSTARTGSSSLSRWRWHS